MTLTEAKKFLGHNLFTKALMTWSLPQLFKTMEHSDCVFSGADQAYEAIFKFRVFELGNGMDTI